MEGFVNQIKKYLDNSIASNEGQILLTSFNAPITNADAEILRIIGKGIIKNITIAFRDETIASNIQINIDGKSKIILPDNEYSYGFPKYFNNGKEGAVEINEIMKFDKEFSITGVVGRARLCGHVLYILKN